MNKRVFNKKGFFLAEETMKILLAVICLGFLIFILGKMYYSYTVNKEVQQAKDTLAYVEKEINSMKDGEKRQIVIYNPAPGEIINTLGNRDYWVLIGFNNAEKPAFCLEKGWGNCLCICKNSWGLINTLVDKCNKDKVCVSFSGKTLPTQQVDLLNLPVTVSVKQDKNAITFS